MNNVTFLADVAVAGGFDADFMNAWGETMIEVRDMFGCDAAGVAHVINTYADDLIDGYYPDWIADVI